MKRVCELVRPVLLTIALVSARIFGARRDNSRHGLGCAQSIVAGVGRNGCWDELADVYPGRPGLDGSRDVPKHRPRQRRRLHQSVRDFDDEQPLRQYRRECVEHATAIRHLQRPRRTRGIGGCPERWRLRRVRE